MTPIHLCAAAGHKNAVQTLLYMVPTSEVFQRNAFGMNATDLAKMKDHQEVVELLEQWVRNHGE